MKNQAQQLADLLREVESFVARRGVSESYLGLLAVNDGKFVQRLRAGKNMTLATIDKVRTYMDLSSRQDAA